MPKRNPITEVPESVGVLEAVKDFISFPDDLRFIRKAEGLSIYALAKALGVDDHVVSYWEKGEHTCTNLVVFQTVTRWAKQLRGNSSSDA